ncbi:AraC family transcriptional regulator [Dyadobacter frigoris]|uniref:Helix-turn-helix domain-containing protein n=1 Tax=Dyadobacter frigoris TaxID=2576211 RepID=A0A4U6D543_9BACT|nr:helix-turn-helix transcriptional regulator [Dyadobacter frigoris]TKT92412.1 helix-turn-helix domain-containing protein [Dyadobacter frigoris]GLU53604.1 AraC family transcriptional regulator [Dyadobacter frigoris]
MLPTLGIDNIIQVPAATESFRILHHQPINMPLIKEAHKHDFFMLLIIENGSGIHTVDFENYEVSDFTVFFLAPGQAHHWDLSPETTGYQILFPADFLQSYQTENPFFKSKSIPFLRINPDYYHQLTGEIRQMEMELKHSLPYTDSIIQSRLLVILSLLRRWYEASYEGSYIVKPIRLLQNFSTLLEEHYQDHNDVAFYAGKLHVTANYLNTVCKRESGQTAGEQIRDRILLEIKRMLILTNADIKEIAFGLGFNDTSYFGRFFKKFTGQTPLSFRKNQ